VRLNWTAATDNVGVAGYRVYRDGVLVGSTSELTYVDAGLAASTTYQYEVRAYDTTVNVGPAAASSVTTTAPVGVGVPSMPAALRATVQSGRSVRLTWTASTDDVGVVGYEVFRNGARTGSTAATFMVDRPGRGRFTYRVRARDADGNVSKLSLPVTVTL
jgi:chitodextrinase